MIMGIQYVRFDLSTTRYLCIVFWFHLKQLNWKMIYSINFVENTKLLTFFRGFSLSLSPEFVIAQEA